MIFLITLINSNSIIFCLTLSHCIIIDTYNELHIYLYFIILEFSNLFLFSALKMPCFSNGTQFCIYSLKERFMTNLTVDAVKNKYT